MGLFKIVFIVLLLFCAPCYGAVNFDGTNDYVSLSNTTAEDNATSATWYFTVKADNTTVAADGAVYSNSKTLPTRYKLLLWQDAGNDKWQAVCDDEEGDR